MSGFLGGIFNNGEILFFIILFLLLFYGCGYGYGYGGYGCSAEK